MDPRGDGGRPGDPDEGRQLRRKPREQQAILESGARAFVVTNANLTGEQLAGLFVANRHRIIQRSRHPGPYIYGVYPSRLERLFPRGEP